MKKCNCLKNMAEENISHEFRLKNIDQTRSYFLKEIKKNELISKMCKKACTKLNYFEHSLILDYAVTGCISNSAVSLIDFLIGIKSFGIELKISAITTGIKMYE